MGWLESLSRESSNQTNVRNSETSLGCRLTSSAIPDGRRGLTTRTTVPMIDLALEYTLGSFG